MIVKAGLKTEKGSAMAISFPAELALIPSSDLSLTIPVSRGSARIRNLDVSRPRSSPAGLHYTLNKIPHFIKTISATIIEFHRENRRAISVKSSFQNFFNF
jgi:hypothetical protein